MSKTESYFGEQLKQAFEEKGSVQNKDVIEALFQEPPAQPAKQEDCIKRVSELINMAEGIRQDTQEGTAGLDENTKLGAYYLLVDAFRATAGDKHNAEQKIHNYVRDYLSDQPQELKFGHVVSVSNRIDGITRDRQRSRGKIGRWLRKEIKAGNDVEAAVAKYQSQIDQNNIDRKELRQTLHEYKAFYNLFKEGMAADQEEKYNQIIEKVAA